MQYKLLFKNLNLVSTNDMYIPTKSTRKGAFLRTSGELAEFQSEFSKRWGKCDLKLDPNTGYKFTIRVSMPEYVYFINNRTRLRARDSSNYIKALEDCVTNSLGYNDRNNIIVSLEKGYNTSESWDVEVVITEYDIENKLEFNEEEYKYVF